MGRDEQYAARMQLLGLVAEGQLTADEGAQRLAVLTRVGSTPLPAENRYPWRDLLTRWNADLLAEPQIVARLPAEVIQSGWLGAPGATDEELRRAEARLGANLPPSYRSFLKVSNGWWSTGFFIQR